MGIDFWNVPYMRALDLIRLTFRPTSNNEKITLIIMWYVYGLYTENVYVDTCARTNGRHTSNHHLLVNSLSAFLKSETKIEELINHAARNSSRIPWRPQKPKDLAGSPKTLQSVSWSVGIYRLLCKLTRQSIKPWRWRWTLPRSSPARPVPQYRRRSR